MTTTAETSGIAPEQRKTLSRTFLALAWVIEIAAAGVGLTLAIGRFQDDVGMMAILAALPFFAVAVMELTKIPFAIVIYHTAAKRWRYGFTVALALSMIITFETFAVGFDIYQAQVGKQIQKNVDAVKDLKLRIASTDDNIAASEAISKGTTLIDANYKGLTATINEKYDKIIESYIEQKLDIDKKYESEPKAIESLVKSIDYQIESRNNRIKDEQKARRKDIENLASQSSTRGDTDRNNILAGITGLETEKKQIRRDTLKEKEQIRDKSRDDYKACQVADAASILGKNCDAIRERDNFDLKSLEEKQRANLKKIQDEIHTQKKRLAGTTVSVDPAKKNEIRKRYDAQISIIRSKIRDLEAEKAAKIAELGKLMGKRLPSDIAQMKQLDVKIGNANTQRKIELGEAKEDAKKRRTRAEGAQGDMANTTKQANKLRKKMAPLCATLNDVVSNNQVYRLAIQFHGVDDACDLTQEQLTWTQWIWYGSLALVTSTLGTALAFAALVIKYPPSFPSGGGIGGMIKGLFWRVNYALALLHRRLRKPKIKEIPVEKEVIKEVTKEVPVDRVVVKIVEVIKEVPVEKVVYRDVPREVVKKEVVHVPLFTQDVKAVVKGD
jgi:hypothetical protein